ncbi:hypothetical protein DSM104299_02737 [Baekduia alba]|uniref:neutral zinc metallopeptidase n=1 Tax=Baekduia alba TaxID=2997333 RepID=UPI00234145F9|nr:neutral zinc metallopeptidase [Baekduia alba]WCB94009.1 hypothetical protein DSM104299_02737 [Baekduia alba]
MRAGIRQAGVAAALVAALAGATACGSDGDDTTSTQQQAATGKELFVARCAGCHTLAAAGARGSATDVHRSERTDGVNFDHRKVSEDDVLFAIRNGGFGSKIMPRGIVAGEDAQAVARFVAESSGSQAATAPDATLESPAVRKMRLPVTGAAPDPSTAGATAASAEFLRQAFDSAQEMWQRQFAGAGARYEPAHLVFFHTQIHTPCGVQTASTGPFYCPPAHGVYLNTDFFEALSRAYDLRSGFAAAYVTAHEMGHHVQALVGLHDRIARLDASDPAGANRRSVALELQADCYAGVWLHELEGVGALTQADIADIVGAATVVGDDFQRNQAGADLAPETWTHGSSAQRVHWLDVGRRSGTPAACDTFTAGNADPG